MKKTILMLTVVLLLVAVPAMAKNNKGDVPKILWVDNVEDRVTIIPAVDEIPDMVKFDWKDEVQAEKYSLDIEGEGTVDILIGDVLTTGVPVEFSVSYSAMVSELTLPVQDVLDDLILAILDELGVGIEAVVGGELLALDAKVKGLDPHDKEDVKSQDNMFSEKVSLLGFFD